MRAMAKPESAQPAEELEPQPEPEPEATPDPARRRTLELLVMAGSAVYAGAIAVPACRFLVPPAGEAGGGRWLRVIRLDALGEGEPAKVQVKGDRRDAFTVTPQLTLGSVWLERRGQTVVALSAECPHLGCAVDLAEGKKGFSCPCHTSRFALDGSVESGPAPRAMDPLAARVVGGWVEVDFRRYRQGAAERVEVG